MTLSSFKKIITMITIPVLNSLRHASALLANADTELLRPEEDSVMLCACYSTKTAARDYLKCFLADKKANHASNSLETLLAECRRLEPAFEGIHLSAFNCRSDKLCDGYCLDAETVSSCFAQAKIVEAFVLENLKVSKEDLLSA
jgi:hypothetical protein